MVSRIHSFVWLSQPPSTAYKSFAYKAAYKTAYKTAYKSFAYKSPDVYKS